MKFKLTPTVFLTGLIPLALIGLFTIISFSRLANINLSNNRPVRKQYVIAVLGFMSLPYSIRQSIAI